MLVKNTTYYVNAPSSYVRFDFDVAGLLKKNLAKQHPDEIPFQDFFSKARDHGIIIEKIDWCGPGSGHPNVFAAAPSLGRARLFTIDVYGCKTADDVENYVDPIFEGMGPQPPPERAMTHDEKIIDLQRQMIETQAGTIAAQEKIIDDLEACIKIIKELTGFKMTSQKKGKKR